MYIVIYGKIVLNCDRLDEIKYIGDLGNSQNN